VEDNARLGALFGSDSRATNITAGLNRSNLLGKLRDRPSKGFPDVRCGLKDWGVYIPSHGAEDRQELGRGLKRYVWGRIQLQLDVVDEMISRSTEEFCSDY
jgi:hypothetical protein